jgi:hypothetical protein
MLSQFGFTTTATSKRKPNDRETREGESSGGNKKTKSGQEADTASRRLSEGQVRNRQLEFPWAVYHLEAGKPDKHIWGCNTCVGTVTIFSRDAHDFRKHAQSKQHDNAVKSKSLALGMLQAQNKAVVKRITQQIDEAGKLLIIVGFMIATGISLRRFPQVCSKQFKIAV